MNCPHCNVKLQISERKSIEIDYCPQCRGVWLDRGELDKLLESSSREYAAGRDRDDDDDRYEKGHKQQRYSNRKSFLRDIFDF